MDTDDLGFPGCNGARGGQSRKFTIPLHFTPCILRTNSMPHQHPRSTLKTAAVHTAKKSQRGKASCTSDSRYQCCPAC